MSATLRRPRVRRRCGACPPNPAVCCFVFVPAHMDLNAEQPSKRLNGRRPACVSGKAFIVGDASEGRNQRLGKQCSGSKARRLLTSIRGRVVRPRRRRSQEGRPLAPALIPGIGGLGCGRISGTDFLFLFFGGFLDQSRQERCTIRNSTERMSSIMSAEVRVGTMQRL